MSPQLVRVGERFNVHKNMKHQMPLSHIGKFSQLPKKHGELAGPGAAVTANMAVNVVGFGVPAAAATVVAATVPGGTALVAYTINWCNASGVTAAYIAGVRATGKAAALACLLWPTP